MIAIDTNIVVRYLTGDHPAQSAKARALIDPEKAFVSVTVMLEIGWLLRSAYGYAPGDVVAALRAFARLPIVTVAEGLSQTFRRERGVERARGKRRRRRQTP